MLTLYYQEPDPDRWLPYDRYVRRAIRRVVRGPRRPGGQERVFLNLCAGLEKMGIAVRVNDFAFARRNPSAPVGIIGKTHLLYDHPWRNPILFGASIMSHPLANPDLLERGDIRRVLVPGEWMRQMCEPYWGARVQSWPVGIDTAAWAPAAADAKTFDVLIYYKIRWEHDGYNESLLEPIRASLRRRGLTFREIRYGFYREEDFHTLLGQARTMVFLCEHETQGIAYQQALACGLPIAAWDRGGYWQDPEYYPDRVKFGPVSSVPYWDERCGERFANIGEFEGAFDLLWENYRKGSYAPRDYILAGLTLEKAAEAYLTHWRETFGEKA